VKVSDATGISVSCAGRAGARYFRMTSTDATTGDVTAAPREPGRELVVVPAPSPTKSPPLYLLAGLASLSPLALDMYLPALPAMTASLGTSPGTIQRTLTVYFAGQCVGMLLAGPLSDRLGRRPLMLIGALVFTLTAFGSAFAQSAESLLTLRFLQALGSGTVVVLARSVVHDVYVARDAPRALSLMALVMGAAPLLAPLIGAGLLTVVGWRSIFALLALLGAGAIAAAWVMLPETHPPGQRGATSYSSAFAAYGRILLNRRGLGYALISGLTSGALFTYLAGAPFVFVDYFGLSPIAFALLFGGNVLGIMLAAAINARLVGRFGPRLLLDFGIVIFVLAATVLALAGSLGIAGIWGVAVPLAFTVGMHQFVLANSLARLMALFPRNAGAAAATQGAVMFVMGAAGSGLVSLLHNGTPAPLCLVIAMMGVGVLASRFLLMGDHAD
jgi:MFS transporter, DHA1 family, multidrug resistance protein